MSKYFTNYDVNSMFGINIPLALVRDKIFKDITPTEKLLYGVISDLVEIAEMNNIRDKDGASYINLNPKFLADIFDISEDELCKHITKLSDIDGKGTGLIKIKRIDEQDRIYLLRFGDIYKYLKGQ